MSATLILPGSLSKWINGKTEAQCQGNTVSECIDHLEREYPGLKDKVINENGDLNNDIFIFINGDNIQSLEQLATKIKDGDEIGIIPFAAGG